MAASSDIVPRLAKRLAMARIEASDVRTATLQISDAELRELREYLAVSTNRSAFTDALTPVANGAVEMPKFMGVRLEVIPSPERRAAERFGAVRELSHIASGLTEGS